MTKLEVRLVNRQIRQDELIKLIRQESSGFREAGQIAHRMKELLPDQLKGLKRYHHRNCKAAVAERKALVDPEYRQSIDEYLNLIEQSQRCRIQYETHKMLLQARQSTRLYQLAAGQVPRSRAKNP